LGHVKTVYDDDEDWGNPHSRTHSPKWRLIGNFLGGFYGPENARISAPMWICVLGWYTPPKEDG